MMERREKRKLSLDNKSTEDMKNKLTENLQSSIRGKIQLINSL